MAAKASPNVGRAMTVLFCTAQMLAHNSKKIFSSGSRNSFLAVSLLPDAQRRNTSMDKDRIKGSAQQAKGKVKEVAGKVTGDAKLESEGKADKAAGKVRNVIGGIKDTLRGK
jgi:uncharacterized protein YjbJ (UPF0337 family)